jgi:hypothetical protein
MAIPHPESAVFFQRDILKNSVYDTTNEKCFFISWSNTFGIRKPITEETPKLPMVTPIHVQALVLSEGLGGIPTMAIGGISSSVTGQVKIISKGDFSIICARTEIDSGITKRVTLQR